MKQQFSLACEQCRVEKPKRRFLQTLIVEEEDGRVYVMQDCKEHGTIFKFEVLVDTQIVGILSGETTLLG
jgi:uncharacterized radical SAM superfamily Fe-S cluster-containing enzyme